MIRLVWEKWHVAFKLAIICWLLFAIGGVLGWRLVQWLAASL